MNRRMCASALLVSLLLLAGLALSCDGNGDGGDPTATPPAGTDVQDEATTDAPAGEAADETDGPPTVGASGGLPFDSFHYVVEIETVISAPGEDESALISGKMEGDYVAPDSHAFSSTFGFAGLSGTTEVIIIGDDAWIREGNGDWTATSRDDPEILANLDQTSADPDFFQDQEFAEDFASQDSDPETINGIETRRYHISRDAVKALVGLLGEDLLADAASLEESEMTIWLGEESGALVRAAFIATASPKSLGDNSGHVTPEDVTVSISVTIDTSRHNDPSIEIEPPI